MSESGKIGFHRVKRRCTASEEVEVSLAIIIVNDLVAGGLLSDRGVTLACFARVPMQEPRPTHGSQVIHSPEFPRRSAQMYQYSPS